MGAGEASKTVASPLSPHTGGAAEAQGEIFTTEAPQPLEGSDPPEWTARRCLLCWERSGWTHPDRAWLRVCTDCRDWIAAKGAEA